MATDTPDDWLRFGNAEVGTKIFTSLEHLYMLKTEVISNSLKSSLFRWDGKDPVEIDTVTNAVVRYSGDDGGVYRNLSDEVYKYGGKLV